jgi:hypothetical protein
MSWGSLAVTFVKLVLGIVSYMNKRQMLKAGEDKVIAETSLRILESTKHGKELRERIRGLNEEEVTSLWDDIINV